MKNILNPLTGIFILLLILNENASAFCGIGGIFGSRMGNQTQMEVTATSTFPNPAFSLVTTSFSLNLAQRVTIKIFDVNARLVSTLADKYFDAGINEVEWNASDLEEGVYFLQVRADAILKMEKLVVAK